MMSLQRCRINLKSQTICRNTASKTFSTVIQKNGKDTERHKKPQRNRLLCWSIRRPQIKPELTVNIVIQTSKQLMVWFDSKLLSPCMQHFLHLSGSYVTISVVLYSLFILISSCISYLVQKINRRMGVTSITLLSNLKNLLRISSNSIINLRHISCLI